MNEQITLPGFDNRGQTYLQDGRILRRIHAEYADQARDLLQAHADCDLAALGIVPTAIEAEQPDLILNHQRYPIVHPHEWPSLALKDAALFQLRLLRDLNSHGLTLKDAVPDNILFDAGQPRFVDFLSLVPLGQLEQEQWLRELSEPGEQLANTVLRNMFTSLFFIPLLAFAMDQPELGRRMLRTQACRMAPDMPTFNQLIEVCPRSQLPWLWLKMKLYDAAIHWPAPACYDRLIEIVTAIKVPTEHGYSGYYDGKGENYSLSDNSEWRAKQLSVDKALNGFKGATTMLDFGANTGWFSRLGASLGLSVTSFEIDEPAINVLYAQAKAANLPITPVLCRWGDLETAIGQDGAPGSDNIYYDQPIARHHADVTVMLGLIHHLALGENRSFDEIFATLAKTCRQGAVIEFIDFDDELVAGNPDYFPAIAQWNAESYNLATALTAARRHFNDPEVLPSHPATRHIIRLVKKL
jgi:hypothetical protein